MNTILTWFERGCRTIVALLLVNVAGIPFSIAFFPFLWESLNAEPPFRPALSLAVLLLLITIYIPWIGFIFPKIVRFCFRPDQILPEPRAAGTSLAGTDES